MNILKFILFLLLTIFIGLPVSFFCAWVYVIALVCAVCCESCGPIVELLEKGVKLAAYFMKCAFD